ncbi:hypothetical protein F5Y08DRAFT_70305 [Xylaria arbuscula]|nr:hypothetical protein F5Y08DRAFT_70305 [Xylaria arbuscula]
MHTGSRGADSISTLLFFVFLQVVWSSAKQNRLVLLAAYEIRLDALHDACYPWPLTLTKCHGRTLTRRNTTPNSYARLTVFLLWLARWLGCFSSYFFLLPLYSDGVYELTYWLLFTSKISSVHVPEPYTSSSLYFPLSCIGRWFYSRWAWSLLGMRCTLKGYGMVDVGNEYDN